MNFKTLLCTLIILLFIPISFAEEITPKVFYDYSSSTYGLKNSDGDIIIEASYTSIGSYYDEYAIVTLDGLYGVIDKSGKEIIAPTYQYIDKYTNGTFIAKMNNKLGALNNRGTIIIPFEYDNLSPFRKNSALALKDHKIGLIRKNNSIVHDFSWDNASIVNADSNYNTFVFVSNGEYGVANFDGKILVKASKTPLNHFSDTEVAFFENNLLGLKNFDEEIILEAIYSNIFETSDGYIVLKNKTYSFLDKKKNKISNDYLKLKKINNHLYSYLDGKAYGLYNVDQKQEVLPAIYSSLETMKNFDGTDSKYIALKIKTLDILKPYKVSLSDQSGNILIKPSYNNMKFVNDNLIVYYDKDSNFGVFNVVTKYDSGLVYSNLNVDTTNNFLIASDKSGKFVLLDKNGKAITDPSQDAILEKGDIFLVLKENNFAIYSKENNKLGTYKYNFFHGFKELNDSYVSVVRSGDRYGVIREDGSTLISTYYDYIDEFKYGYSIVTKNRKSGLIDSDGNLVIDMIYNNLYLISDKLAIYSLDGKLGYMKTDGNITINAKYDTATGFNEFGYAVVGIDGEKGLIRKNGTIALKRLYSDVRQISENQAVVKDKVANTFGIVDLSGNIITELIYDEIGVFNENNVAYIKVSSKYALINKTGEIITDFKYDTIGAFIDGLAKVTIDGESGFINAKGEYFN